MKTKVKLHTTLLAMALAAAGSSAVSSQIVERVYLTDGTVYDGFICRQRPGDSISVNVTQAMMVASADSLLSASEREVQLSRLSPEWKRWAAENDTSASALRLSTLTFANSSFPDVKVVSTGDTIRFLTQQPGIRDVEWRKVAKTVRFPRNPASVTGIDDIVILNNDVKHRGYVVEQCPGRTIKIVKSDSTVVTVNASQVKELQSVAVSNDYPALQQSQLLDRIVLGNGRTVEGLISSRKMGHDLTILTPDSGELKFPMVEIQEYQKFVNPNYKEVTGSPLADGEVRINGAPEAAGFIQLPMKKNYLIVGEQVSETVDKGSEIVIEARLTPPTASVSVVKACSVPFFELGKGNSRKWVITYQDIVEKSLPVDRTISASGVSTIKFCPDEAGYYVISIQGHQGFIVINVKQ